jgi:Putative Ig domain
MRLSESSVRGNRRVTFAFTVCLLASSLLMTACGGSSTSSGGSGGGTGGSGGGTGGSGGGGGSSVSVTTTTLPGAKVGTAYSATLQATGGTAPYTWTAAPGMLGTIPPGLTLNTSGTITGTPTEPGPFNSLLFVATDSRGATGTSSALSIQVAALPLTITTTSLPNGIIGQPYDDFLTSAGGNPPYNWTIKSGVLAAGLTLNASSGGIKGTPTSAGTNPLVFQVTDSDGTVATSTNLSLLFTLNVATTSLPDGKVNVPYSTTLQATGGTPPYTWSFPDGRGLPPGVTLNPNGTLSGTPTQPGSYGALVFQVTDAAHATANSHNLLIKIDALPLVITTTSLPEGFVRNNYFAPLTYTGGDPPVNFGLAPNSPPLPQGLSFTQCLCAISGKPTTAGTTNIILTATDSDGTVVTAPPIPLQIGPEPLTLITESLPNGTIGSPYSAMLQAEAGFPPYTFAFQSGTPIGTLPPNVYLNTAGLISGTPLAEGQGPDLYFQVTDSHNAVAYATVPNIVLSPELVIDTTSLPNGNPNVPYSATLQGSGGTPPYTWSISSGALPNGLNLTASTGLVSGTPTMNQTTSTVFKLTDVNGATALSTTITIKITTPPPLTVLNASLPGTNGGELYNATLQAANGTPPYTWIKTSGSLPPGLGLSSAGVISGVATGPGSAMVFQVTDSKGATALSPSLTIQFTDGTCPTGAENKLGTQPYAFLLKGFDQSGPVVIAGSFTPNMTGGIVDGEEDINTAGGYTHVAMLDTTDSSYTLHVDSSGVNPRGCLTLATSSTTKTTYRFSLSGSDGNGHYLTGQIIEFDDTTGTGTHGSGILRRQNTASFAAGLVGTYAFQFTGTDKNNGHFAIAGSMNAANTGITNLIADSDDAGAVHSNVTGGSGTLGNSESGLDGRNTARLVVGSSVLDIGFVFYQVDANEAIFASTDPFQVNPVIGGEALTSVGPFTTAQLSNFFIYHTGGTSSGGSAATVGAVNFDGTSTVTGKYFQDAAGTSTGPNPITGSYGIDTQTGAQSGRVLFTGNFGGGSPPVGYMVAPAAGDVPSVFMVGTDSAATSGLLDFQSTTSSVNLNGLTGPFALGTDENLDDSTANLTGEITITPGVSGAYLFAGTDDVSDPGAGGLAGNQVISGTAHFGSDGTGDFGPPSAAVTNGKVTYYINEDPTITHPVVTAVAP